MNTTRNIADTAVRRRLFSSTGGASPSAGKVLALLLVLQAALVGCAKVGEPLPPFKPVPSTQDLTGVRTGNRVLFEFSIPPGEWNTVELHVVCNKDDPQDTDFQLNAAVARSQLAPSAQDRSRLTYVTTAFPASVCHYAVRFVNPSGVQSEFSNRVVIR